MAEFANLHDEGFEGRLFPHQRAKLRENFCLNPWPDTALLYQIAADIGAPVLLVSNYYNYVRNSQNQSVPTQQQYVGLSSETIQKLDQFLLLDSTPSFQAVTNIARDLSIPRRMVEQYFNEKRSKEDDIDNMLDEIFESPPSMMGSSSDGDSFNYFDVQNPISSQDELMLALSEVGLSTGQMSKFCSEVSAGDSDTIQASSDQFLFSNDPKAGDHLLVQTELGSCSSTNLDPQMISSQTQHYSYNQNPVLLSNQVQHFPQPGDHLQRFGQSFKTYPYQQSYPSAPSGNQKMLATWPDPVWSRSMSGQAPLWQQSQQSTEYEVRRDSKQVPPQHLFHQYMKPVRKISPPKPILAAKVKQEPGLDVSFIKSEFPFQPIESTSSPDADHQTRSCSSFGTSTVIKKELFHDKPMSPQDVIPVPNKIMPYEPHSTSVGIIQKSAKAKRCKKGKVQTANPNPPVSILSPKPTASRKRNSRCKVCPPCLDTDCGQCVYCLDKPKFGGPNRKKCACLNRRCLNMTSRLSPRNSSMSISTPKKQLTGTEAFSSQALDDIPFEIEGHYNSMVPAASGTWNLPQTELNHQVRYPDSIPNSTPVKRHLLEDIKIEKKMRMDSVNHSQNVLVEENQQCTRDVSVKVENYLQIYKQYKGLESERKSEALRDSERNDDQYSLKERLHALRFDHCYTQNVEYFKGLEEEDYSGNKMNKTVDIENVHFFEISQNETSEADLGKEENLAIVKTEVASSPENEQQSVEAFPVVSETRENIEEKESFDDDFEEEELNDEIGPIDDDEELLKSDDQVSPCDQNSGQLEHSIDGKSPESSPFSDKVVDDLDQMLNLEGETEELLIEEYDEFDSFEKKEIEEQLAEDFTEEFEEESALDVSDILSSFSAFDFESLDTNILHGESNENLVISPSDVKSESCLNPENLKAEFSFRSESDRSEELLGSDGNSSPCSDGSVSPPPDESKPQFTLDDLVSQSEYFQTRPSVLKLWKAKDQSLEVDKNLPAGWRMKVYTRKSGRMDIHYITPENMDVKTKFGVMEYMRLSRNYTMAEVERVAEYLRVRSDQK